MSLLPTACTLEWVRCNDIPELPVPMRRANEETPLGGKWRNWFLFSDNHPECVHLLIKLRMRKKRRYYEMKMVRREGEDNDDTDANNTEQMGIVDSDSDR